MRVLRGRVVIREDLNADHAHLHHIIVPGVSTKHDKDAVARARTWHRGEVVAMGDPAQTKRGVDVPHGFQVGDTVLFHFEHYEKSWTIEWVDGTRVVVVPQQAVDGVIEP